MNYLLVLLLAYIHHSRAQSKEEDSRWMGEGEMEQQLPIVSY